MAFYYIFTFWGNTAVKLLKRAIAVASSKILLLLALNASAYGHLMVLMYNTCSFVLLDEPMVKALGGVSPRDESVVAHIRQLLSHGVTVIAVDDTNGNVVGHMINCLYTRDALRYKPQSLNELRSVYNDAYGTVMFASEKMFGPHVVLNAKPEDHLIMDFYGASVNPAYRGREIAKNLVKHSLEVAIQ